MKRVAVRTYPLIHCCVRVSARQTVSRERGSDSTITASWTDVTNYHGVITNLRNGIELSLSHQTCVCVWVCVCAGVYVCMCVLACVCECVCDLHVRVWQYLFPQYNNIQPDTVLWSPLTYSHSNILHDIVGADQSLKRLRERKSVCVREREI